MNKELKVFISNHDVDKTENCISKNEIKSMETALGVSFGEQLSEYILQFGYLGYGFIELYGINSLQGLNSDLIQQTLYLHQYYPETAGLIAIENQGEGDYFLIDSSDSVYEFDSAQKELVNLNCKLYDYVLQRFTLVDRL